MHTKNAHMMPNNGLKTTYFLVRLSTWFDELFRKNLSGKKHILHITNNMSMMNYWMSHHNIHHQNINNKKEEYLLTINLIVFSRVMNVLTLDLNQYVCSSSFKHTFSNRILSEMQQKTHLMPNNSSKTTNFLARLFSWF
jgi:hypothetical protein